jgi:ABC-2 type transport system ATP-binding protein
MTIMVEQLARSFGPVEAVKGIDFAVGRGEIFGFLGPNGAGKSTTIKMLCTLLRPSGGRAVVNGHDVMRAPMAVRRSIGIVFQDPTLDEYLSAEQNLRYHCMLYHTPPGAREGRLREVLGLVGLEERRKDLVRTFSGGMKRRLEVARGLLHQPQTLFLDEPTVELDPQTRRSVWEHVLRLREATGLTIFMTTHYMDEAEYCDRIAIIDHGRIVALDTPEALKRLVGRDVVRIAVAPADEERTAAEAAQRVGRPVQSAAGVVSIEGAPAEQGQAVAAELIQHLTVVGIAVQGVTVQAPSLDDAFVHLTGRAIREETAGAKERMEAGLRGRGRLRRR